MFDITILKENLTHRMEIVVENLQKEFSSLMTGRANTQMLNKIKVHVYGTLTPLNEISSISIPEVRMIFVRVWDKTLIQSVEKAIVSSDLGLNPISDGTLIRVPIAALSEERRIELSKIAKKYAEQARISIRNIRRDGIETMKKQKSSDISKDSLYTQEKEIQKLTDKIITRINKLLQHKEHTIMQI